MRTPKLVLTTAALAGAFGLAAAGQLDAEVAVAFAAGALALPSGSEAAREVAATRPPKG